MNLSPRTRLELASRLRARGFHVRLHAYELLLGFRGRILGVLLLEPGYGKATLFLSPAAGSLGEPLEALREELGKVYPDLALVVEGGERRADRAATRDAWLLNQGSST